MSLLPSSPDVAPDGEPRVVGLDSEEADDLMAALSSTTARRLLAELHEDPAPPGELADRVDTSLQNAQYHLENLEDAGAIEVVGTAYSEKGREMRVYGPADSPLVIFAGEKERASGLRAALSRLFGGFAALALASLAIQQAFGRSLLAGTGDQAVPAGGTATPTPEGGAAGGGDAGDGGDESGPGAFDTQETTTETYTGSDDGASAGTETPQETAQPSPTAEDADSGETTSGSPTETASAGEDAAAEPAATDAMDTATETATDTAAGTTPTPSGDEFDLFGVFEAAFGSGLPPGLAFFLGGATVLTLFVATTYVQARP